MLSYELDPTDADNLIKKYYLEIFPSYVDDLDPFYIFVFFINRDEDLAGARINELFSIGIELHYSKFEVPLGEFQASGVKYQGSETYDFSFMPLRKFYKGESQLTVTIGVPETDSTATDTFYLEYENTNIINIYSGDDCSYRDIC